jgi:hypothetical protein
MRKIGQISINQNHPPYKKRVRFILVQRRLHPRALDPFGMSAVHIAPRRAAIAWKCCRMHALAIFHLFAGPRCAWLWLVGAGAEAAAALRSLSAQHRGAVRVEPLPSEAAASRLLPPAERAAIVDQSLEMTVVSLPLGPASTPSCCRCCCCRLLLSSFGQQCNR